MAFYITSNKLNIMSGTSNNNEQWLCVDSMSRPVLKGGGLEGERHVAMSPANELLL